MKRSPRRLRHLVVAALTTVVVVPAMAQNIAVVNGKPIPKARADEIVAEVTKQGQADSPELDAKIKDELIKRELVLQEAEKRGLTKDPEVLAEIDKVRQNVVIQATLADYMKNNPPTDQELHARYDEIVAQQYPPKEYHAHHILVDTEAEAKAIIAKLNHGAKFDDLAKASSKDKGSAEKGGDLGWANPNGYVPSFAEALQKLQPHQITQTPVQTQFGYHVIRLDEVRDNQNKPPAFDQVKAQVANSLMADKNWQAGRVKAFIDDLRSKARIE